LPQSEVLSGSTEGAPCFERGVTAVLEILAADECAFLVEVVVDRAVDCGEFLQTSRPPEAEHGPLPSSKRLMRVLGPVVLPTTDDASVVIAERVRRQAEWDQSGGSVREALLHLG
jgi:hypothetical protein